MRLLLQRLLLIAGVGALGFTGYTYAARFGYQFYEARQFDRALDELANTPHAAEPLPSVPSLVGRIEIPRLGISAMVKEGVDEETLDLAVGHIPSTALPGRPGNFGVAAHRDNLFRSLKDVRQDDEITVTTLENTYRYLVVSLRIVKPTEVSVLAPTPDENTLTLVTCYPFYYVGHAPWRFIVRARQVTSRAAVVGQFRTRAL